MKLLVTKRCLANGAANLLLLLVTAACLFMWPEPDSGVTTSVIATCLILAALTVCVHFLREREPNWLRIDTLFLIGYLIVNFQWPLMLMFASDLPQQTQLLRLIGIYGTFVTWLSTVALTCWSLGYAVAIPNPRTAVDNVTKLQLVTVCGFGLLLLFALTAGPEYLSGAVYKEMRAGNTVSVTGLAGYVFTSLGVVVPVMMFAALYRLRIESKALLFRSWTRIFAAPYAMTGFVLMTYLVVFLVAGERGQIIQIVSGAALAIGASIRPIGLFRVALLVGIGAVSVTFLGVARSVGWLQGMSLFASVDPWTFTQNLANSVITNYLGVEIVLLNDSLYHGQLWISNILGAIPFATSAFMQLMDLAPHEVSGPALITRHALGEDAHTGLGTSLVVDIYMNVGTTGTMAMMFLYGIACRAMQLYLSGRYGFVRFLAAGVFGSLVFYMARGSLFVQLLPTLWGGLIALSMIRNVRRSGSSVPALQLP